MATFKVLSIAVNQVNPEIINTLVEYTFNNGHVSTIDVVHFRPTSRNEMATSIINRGKSEWSRLVAVAAAESAIAVLNSDINVSFSFSQT